MKEKKCCKSYILYGLYQNIEVTSTTQQQQKIKYPFEKWAKGLNRYFSEDNI